MINNFKNMKQQLTSLIKKMVKEEISNSHLIKEGLNSDDIVKDIHHWISSDLSIDDVDSVLWAMAMQYSSDEKFLNTLIKYLRIASSDIKKTHEK